MAAITPIHSTAATEDALAQPLLPDAQGQNLFAADPDLRGLLALYLDPQLFAHLLPHIERLGALAGTRLDTAAAIADRNPSQLHHRARNGEHRQWIEKHPAYRELEQVAFAEYGLAAMSHRAGVLGWPSPLPPLVKYALTYVFVQAEFGVCCPLSMTDAAARTISKFADPALAARYLPGLTAQDMDSLTQGAMFMTEQGAGSDVGATRTQARREHNEWRLYGDKWFCSNADAGVALVLARPQGAATGTRGLSLFLLPARLPDGRANRYRIVRLKDKLGTRAMPSGEIILEGANAYMVGDPERGFVQMADMINMSRLSNGMRAAGLMRRALSEALFIARGRDAFGQPLIHLPLMRRQLLKIMLAAESARTITFRTALELAQADAGDSAARLRVRLLTPLLKFRACRDARRAAGDAMEVRGGAGYIEEWSDARVLRDAHLGSIWEGTSNIVALDVMRAIRREAALDALQPALEALIDALPTGPLREALALQLQRACQFARDCAANNDEANARQAATGLYYASAAVYLADEGHQLGQREHNARRQLLAGLCIVHRLQPRDPLQSSPIQNEQLVADQLLSEAPVSTQITNDLLQSMFLKRE